MLQQMIRNPEFRRIMFSPEVMRMQLQMQRSMGGDPSGAASAFPAPGATDNTPATADDATATPAQQNPAGAADPFGAFGAAGAGNPFASLFPAAANTQPGAAPQPGATPNAQEGSTPPTPFPNLFGGAQGGQANPIAEAAQRLMQNPEAMQSMMQMMGGAAGPGAAGSSPFGAFGQNTGATAPTPGAIGAGAANNPFAALFGPGGFGAGGGGFGAPAAPVDTRPPEEVYESQLGQLNEMGFYEFDRNVSALRRSGGNVQGAIEYLLNGGA